MRGGRVEDLPEGLTPAAKKARKKFLDQVHRDLEGAEADRPHGPRLGPEPRSKDKDR